MADTTFTVASFFAGVGGIDLGMEQTGRFRTVYANEVDPYPAQTFEENFDLEVDVRDIGKVSADEVPATDVIVGGFPCQAFSLAGYRQGFADAKGRGLLFFEMMRMVREHKPSAVLFENVKNLVGHDGGNTFRVILEALETEGYFHRHKVLNAMEYGNIPQNRERIYIVGFRSKRACDAFSFPDEISLTTKLGDIIDMTGKVDDRWYYTDGKYSGDIYDRLSEAVTERDAVYQWRRRYVRRNKSGVIPTLTANMGGGGHNVPIVLTDTGIRRLTPHECFNAQGFPADFRLPSRMSASRLYKQAGNSVCVSVIRRIAESMAKALDEAGVTPRDNGQADNLGD